MSATDDDPITISALPQWCQDQGDVVVDCKRCGASMRPNPKGNLYTTYDVWFVCDDCGMRLVPDLMPRLRALREKPLVMAWVALETWVNEATGMFYEAGGVYPDEPTAKGGSQEYRELEPAGEHEALCPRCGHRFAATEHGTAESHRDLHFDGDEDCPSICRNMPTRRNLLRLVG